MKYMTQMEEELDKANKIALNKNQVLAKENLQ